MKLFKQYLIITILFLSTQVFATDIAYTINGKKDSRLEATYIAIYSGDCKEIIPSREGFRPLIETRSVRKSKKIEDGNYTINFNEEFFQDKDNWECNYKLNSIIVVVRRNKDKLYSSFGVFSRMQSVQVRYFGSGDYQQKKNGRSFHKVYDGWLRGNGHKKINMPRSLNTYKKHFLLPLNSELSCATKWYKNKRVAHGKNSDFHCLLKVKDGEGKNALNLPSKHIFEVDDSQFGVDKITNTTLNINILVNNDACRAYKDSYEVDEPYHFIETGGIFSFANYDETNNWQELEEIRVHNTKVRKKRAGVNPLSKLSKDGLQLHLHASIIKRDIEKIKKLCDAGANPNITGSSMSNTAIEVSIMASTPQILQVLLDNGGKQDAKTMILASSRDRLDMMLKLQENGGDINQKDENGCSTLHYIAKNGTVESITYLVKNRGNPNGVCDNGENPMDWAIKGNNKKVMKYLKNRFYSNYDKYKF